MSEAASSLVFLFMISVLACSPQEQSTAFEQLLVTEYDAFYQDTLRVNQKEFVIAVLTRQQEDSLADVSDEDIMRPLIVLEKNNRGQFDLAVRNDSLLLCLNCGGLFGDPLNQIEITANGFTASHYGGSRFRWTRHTSFEYNEAKNEWLLTADNGISYDSFDPEESMEEQAFNTLSDGEPIKLTSYNIYKD
jgi:hypothetical protein